MRKTKFLLPLMLMLVVVMCLPAFAAGENLWADSGFDALTVNGENQVQNTDEYRYFSQANWQSKKMVETNENVYFRMTGTGSGNPMMRNKEAFDVDTTKKHVITFKASEIYDASGLTAKVYVYFSNVAIDSGFELISAAEAGTATAINYYVPDHAQDDTSSAPIWHDVTYTIPAGVDFKYIYFLVPAGYLGLDDIAVTPVDVDVDVKPAVVAAGLMEREVTDSLAFAAYVTNEATISDFGFEVSATDDFTNAIVVDDCAVVANNGAFCGVSAAGDYYMVRVNGVPADKTVYVRAYSVFNGKKVYSQVASASANDVLDANP